MNREPVPIDEIDGYVTKDSMYRLISQYKREGRISQATAQDMCNAIAYSIGVERTKDRWIWDAMWLFKTIQNWFTENKESFNMLLREIDNKNIEYFYNNIDNLYEKYKEITQ